MRVDGVHHRTIRLAPDGWAVEVIDQTRLPDDFRLERLESLEAAAGAIESMVVRGAPLIGATAAYGLALALRADPSDPALAEAVRRLAATRPTAVNLRWALDAARCAVLEAPDGARAAAAYDFAGRLCEQDVAVNRAIGEHGVGLLEAASAGTRPVRVLTHCNAGWLATVDCGTATAPIYQASEAGAAVHVWVDETRPRLQGAALTAWELGQEGIPYTVVPDSAAAHLMSRGEVDLVLVGTDRTTAAGDVVNKIGTYPLALAAADNGVPFYVAVPSSSIDWSTEEGQDVPIEERSAEEVTNLGGRRIAPSGARAVNFAFDVTPRRLVTGLVTERGVCAAEGAALRELFPDRGSDGPT